MCCDELHHDVRWETDDEGRGTMEGNMATDDNHSGGTMSHGFTLEPTDSAAQDSQSAGHV